MNNHAKLTALQDAIRSRVLQYASSNTRIIYTGDGNSTEQEWIFDFRAIMLEPRWLDTYATLFWDTFESRYPFQVGGMETAAIALVAAIVMKGVERKTPVNGFYLRKSRKREGLLRQIEGTLNDQPIILVDDLIHTGGSFRKQLTILESLGKKVTDLFTIVAFYDAASYTFARERGITVSFLFPLDRFGVAMPPKDIVAPNGSAFTELWKFSAGDPGFEYVVQKSAPIIDDGRVYFGTDRGVFYALEQSNGDVVWQFTIGKHPSHKGIFSTPVVHKGIVYFGGYDGNVYALDAKSGALRWKNSDADWIGSSPTIAPQEGLLYVGLEFGLFSKRGGIAAIDISSGKTTWSDRTPALTHGSPLYIATRSAVVVGSNDGVVYAYDATHGERLWTFQTGGDIKTRPAYDEKHDSLIVASMDAKVYALSMRDGSVMWAYQTGGPLYSIPLVVNDTVYVASLDKSLYALDAATGTKKWEFVTNGRIFASPIVAEGSLWIGSNDGVLYEIDTATGKKKASHQLSERIVNAIAYNAKTKHFFVPTVANEMYCLKHT